MNLNDPFDVTRVPEQQPDQQFTVEVAPNTERAGQHVAGLVALNVYVSSDLATTVSDSYVRGGGDDGELSHPLTLGDLVAQEVVKQVTRDTGWNGLRHRIAGILDEEIRAQVAPLIEQALTRGFPRTNIYGEPVAGTTTLSELIMGEVKKVLTQHSSDYNSKDTVLQKMVREAVVREFSKVVTEQVAAIRKEAADQVAEAVKTAIATAMKGK